MEYETVELTVSIFLIGVIMEFKFFQCDFCNITKHLLNFFC